MYILTLLIYFQLSAGIAVLTGLKPNVYFKCIFLLSNVTHTYIEEVCISDVANKGDVLFQEVILFQRLDLHKHTRNIMSFRFTTPGTDHLLFCVT